MCVIHKQHIFENWIFSILWTFFLFHSYAHLCFTFMVHFHRFLFMLTVCARWIGFCCFSRKQVHVTKFMFEGIHKWPSSIVPSRYMMVMCKYKMLDGLNKETMSVIDWLMLMICILSNQPFDKNERTFVHCVWID